MQQLRLLICCAVLLSLPSLSDAQILNKIKQKAQQAADKVIDKKVDDAVNNQTNNNNQQTNNNNNGMNNQGAPGANSKSRPTNKGGQGLITTPPNVNENLASAETAFKGGKYSDARYSVQQAMLGVEMEIGKQILAGLPESLSGLKKDPSSDQVTSTGWGWAGLTIKRDYNQDDKQLSFTIANNATWMQAINMYLTNGGYMQTSGNEQKWKQVKIQDQRAVIEYDQSSGYKLSVPLGQTSLLMYEGVNFANEQDFMNAANQINIEQIKKQLGEK
jgi:hypothetical protein